MNRTAWETEQRRARLPSKRRRQINRSVSAPQEGFSLREVARRTGVSPAAPAHHFSDARGLPTAVATQTFLALGDALEASEPPGGDREARLLAQLESYLVFALNSRGRYLLMWRKTILDPEQAELVAAAGRAFAMLDRRFEAARESRSGRATRHKPPLLRAGPWCMAWHC
jgi:AcrR family transcriptional regulator